MKDFVTYEPALALKELGFDEPCLAYWYNETPTNSEGQCLVYYKKPWDNQNIINGIIKDYYYAPLYQQAFRWFREKYYIHCEISETTDCEEDNESWTFIVYKYKFGDNDAMKRSITDYNTYEEAELACLIKLIEIVKTKQL